MIRILTYVVTIICVLSLGLFDSKGNETENNAPMKVAEVENTIAESEAENSSQLEVIEDPTVNQTEMSETNTTQEQIVKTQPTITTQQNTQEKKTQESSSSKPTPTTQATPNKQTNSQPQVNTDTSKQQKTQTQSQSTKESFKENTAIINEIRNIINANPSTYMKQLGYNIIVDSSIVNKTTGFTYTQTRVKNAIANSFGTIRIYARDYYVGNELRWTEGFIL